ncbi:MAG: MurR/RpiR family transcriptional regulator, partial [Lachnospiraceae bacterium]|nr:MurR/RpiR family transcriptional regulator [Lachnospiraceae bacterium]
MTIIHDLIALYNQLPRDNVYSLVIVCILQNLSKIPGLSLEQTAELCGVSPITISRLLKKLSCSSYREFKQQIGDVTDAYSKYNRVIPIPLLNSDNVTDSYLDCITNELEYLKRELDREALAKACEMIHKADNVQFCDMYSRGHAKRQF